MMKGNLIYYAIIIVGVGAIAYMYNLSDLGNKNKDKDTIDDLVEKGNLKIK